jgi:hypothetical protein
MKRVILFVSLGFVCSPFNTQGQPAQQPCCNSYTGPQPEP